MKLPEFHHHQRLKPKNYGLDLARACAVAFVFFSHSLLTLYSSGIPYLWYGVFIGVELFFSLSGFLIGRMLIDLFDHDNVSFEQLANFWTRRWFRTLPLYFVLYFIYYLAYNKWIYPVAFDWRYLLFLQNLTTPPPVFFGESWSLGIEEWFYFLFPLVLFVAYLFKMRFMPVVLSIILAQVTVRWLYPGCMDWGCISVLLHFDAAAYGLIAAYLSKQNFQVNTWTWSSGTANFSGHEPQIELCLLAVVHYFVIKKFQLNIAKAIYTFSIPKFFKYFMKVC